MFVDVPNRLGVTFRVNVVHGCSNNTHAMQTNTAPQPLTEYIVVVYLPIRWHTQKTDECFEQIGWAAHVPPISTICHSSVLVCILRHHVSRSALIHRSERKLNLRKCIHYALLWYVAPFPRAAIYIRQNARILICVLYIERPTNQHAFGCSAARINHTYHIIFNKYP